MNQSKTINILRPDEYEAYSKLSHIAVDVIKRNCDELKISAKEHDIEVIEGCSATEVFELLEKSISPDLYTADNADFLAHLAKTEFVSFGPDGGAHIYLGPKRMYQFGVPLKGVLQTLLKWMQTKKVSPKACDRLEEAIYWVDK